MSEIAENLFQKAEHLTEVERWREAVPLLLKVIAQNPQHFQAYCLLSLCHYSLKDNEKALEFAEKAITVAPEEEWGHRLRSVALSEQGKKKEALKSAEEAVRLAPFEPYVLQVLVNAYLSSNKPRKAEEIALKMRENFPDSEASFFTLGNVYLQRGNNAGAEKCFREALRIDPNSADARNNLGVALLRQKQNEDTALFKSSNLSLFPNKEEEDIHQHFTEAIRLEPNNHTAAANLRSQFDYFYVLYAFLIFVPFFLIAFFVAPGMTIFMVLIGILGVFKLLGETRQMRKSLSPEMKMFLKSASGKRIFRRFKEFYAFACEIFKKTWKPHLLALTAVIVRYSFRTPKLYSTSWNDLLAIILLIASLIWLISKIKKD